MKVCTSKNAWVSAISALLLSTIGWYILGKYALMIGHTCMFIFLFSGKKFRKSLIVNTISSSTIISSLFWHHCTTIDCNKPVYYRCFVENHFRFEKGRPFIILSQSAVCEYAFCGYLWNFNPEKEIILPDTKKVRLALAPYMEKEHWIRMGTQGEGSSVF